MPAYEVIGGATNLRVQGDNWLSALGASLEYFGLDSGAVARLVINVGSDGTVDVSDPVSGRRFALKPAEEVKPASLDLNQFADPAVMELDSDTGAGAQAPAAPPVPPPTLSMPGQSLLDDSPPPPPPAVEPPAPPPPVEPPPPPRAKGPPPPPPGLVSAPVSAEPVAPPPVVPTPPPVAPTPPPVEPQSVAPTPPPQPLAQKPTRASHTTTMPPEALEQEDDRPGDLAEQLFELTFEIMMANDVGEACHMSLETLRNLVPAEAGAVLYSDINSVGLTFMSAFGPAAGSLQGKTISFETGVAGFCHQHGVGLVIQDTVTDERHDKSVDQAVGFQTRSILAAAVLSPGGHTYGCIELLNAPDGFRDWHLEAAQAIAGALADFASRREFQ